MQLPQAFIDRTCNLIGEKEFDLFMNALQEEPPISVRVNDKVEYVPSAEKVSWCDLGYYLPA